MAPTLRFEQGVRTHVGAVRKINEDSHLARPQDGLWAVADGMGGHIKGQWASSTIVRALSGVSLEGGFEDAAASVISALESANGEIYQAAWEAGGAIGSTVAVLLIRGARCAVLWAGDSRVYRCRDRVLQPLTTDHSQVEQMVASGLLDRAEADNHPMAHVLSRAVGVREALVLDRIDAEVEAGDVFLLCSDGLSRMVRAPEIQNLLVDKPPRAVAARLVDMALDRGAPDNVTVAVVGCDATTMVEVG
ncbi:PP2C family protein-serine/threonine phosphatase [Sphingomonas oligoaromativorans]|jgi:serine/threonine protein phosphatase PrpC|uniref:PP2C family protein-serine/threonine phosphatase n=1 Tax=Sphingomonas oligoaromativorans TaxID=575322 RepID=UPI0014224511|nr:protein phosphatase 2C domain-containing protein [Sphingomonas oligoaromativorans]NIJ32476.1 serine/threonine protein phosphatase PrpC [Sphingomonas oligoaromativorans]